MTHSHPMLDEVASLTLLAIQTAATSFLLAVLPADEAELMSWTLLPMIGATLAAGGAFCLNTQQEVRKIVVGRCLFTIVVGVVGPRMLSMMHPWMAGLMADPLLKVGAGFALGFCGYVLSWPFVKKAYERAPLLAAQHVQALETRMVDRLTVRVDAAADARWMAEDGGAGEPLRHGPQRHAAVEAIAAAPCIRES
ncbi:MAG: hypothetical protein ACO1TE_06430 [Prosthecobacter sp.]